MSKLIVFQKSRSKTIELPRPLAIAGNIPQVEQIEVLGLLFQSRHSWIPHIKSIRTEYIRNLNSSLTPLTDVTEKLFSRFTPLSSAQFESIETFKAVSNGFKLINEGTPISKFADRV